jgi:hypothetical protein
MNLGKYSAEYKRHARRYIYIYRSNETFSQFLQ